MEERSDDICPSRRRSCALLVARRVAAYLKLRNAGEEPGRALARAEAGLEPYRKLRKCPLTGSLPPTPASEDVQSAYSAAFMSFRASLATLWRPLLALLWGQPSPKGPWLPTQREPSSGCSMTRVGAAVAALKTWRFLRLERSSSRRRERGALERRSSRV